MVAPDRHRRSHRRVEAAEAEAAREDGFFFFSSRRRHTRLTCDWSSDVCSSDLILLVDDEPLVRSSAAAMLEAMGHNVRECAAGAEALALVERGYRPDLLVTDQAMPADRKSTRLNSSHMSISYAVFCLKKKKKTH